MLKVLIFICCLCIGHFGFATHPLQWHHNLIHTDQSWNLTKGSSEIVVAVIDNGVDFSHEALKTNAWQNQKEKLNGLDDDNNGYIDDIHGWNFLRNNNNIGPEGTSKGSYHGTHIAGTIAGTNQKMQISGVAPRVKIMALPFLDEKKSGKTSSGIAAIRYAIDNGAQIINLSWGSFNRNNEMLKVLRLAEKKGILVVAASGNYSSNVDTRPFYPAAYSFVNLISVGALDKNGSWLKGTNYGPNSIHIAAPGENILSTSRLNGYDQRSGSSMAAPIISGLAALLLSYRPSLTGFQLKNLILEGADQFDQLKGFVKSGRRANAFKSFKTLQESYHSANAIDFDSHL